MCSIDRAVSAILVDEVARLPMALTRNIPRPEGKAALRNLIRAGVYGAIAQGLYYYAFDIARLLPAAVPKTWRGFPLADVAAAVVGSVGLVYLVAAIRRIRRWLIARKHLRMLNDPDTAALVPPLPSHVESLEPPKPRQVVQSAAAVLVLLGIVAIMVTLLSLGLVRLDAGEDEFPAFEVLAGALLLLVFAARALWRDVRRFVQERRIQRASREPVLSADRTPRPRGSARSIPRLIISPPVLPSVAATVQEITLERNVFGRRPWNIAYLRLFDNEKGLQEFLEGAWRECGYVHLIKDADSISPDEAQAMAQGSEIFINSRGWLLAELARRPVQPLSQGRRELAYFSAEPVRVNDRYGSYPVRALICHETFWKTAVDVLLERADLVVIDLHGYHWNNTGTAYELQRVVDRFPIERCVILAAGDSDTTFLHAQIQQAWSQMAEGSPNEGTQPREVLMAQQSSGSSEQSRALAAVLQQRLDGLQMRALS